MAEASETKTYCIGRFLVDVPVDFELEKLEGSVRTFEVTRIGEGNKTVLSQMISDRIRSIKNGEVGEDIDSPDLFLGSDNIGGVTLIKRVIDTSFAGLQIFEPWSEEAFLLSEGVIFHLTGAGSEATEARTRENLGVVSQSLRPRDPNEIPDGAVTCLYDSFFSPAPGDEFIGATFIHRGNYPISLQISTSHLNPGDTTLPFSGLEGPDGNPVKIAGFDGKELRLWNSRINLSAIVGQQASTSRPGYKLTLEYTDSIENVSSGYFSREHVERIWENFISSIRFKR